MVISCDVCCHKCNLKSGQTGMCLARIADGGVTPVNYGHVTSIALDPIEKKPLYHFHPGSNIISVGSYGCNLKCPFCQNNSISMSDNSRAFPEYEYVSADDLVDIAKKYVPYGNIGVAFTYNEPLICYEYVRDVSKKLKENDLCSVVVTNGCFDTFVADEIGPYVDAMNIDLKSFSDEYYRKVLKGDLNTVKEFIRTALKYCHVELTTLVVAGNAETANEYMSDDRCQKVSGEKETDVNVSSVGLLSENVTIEDMEKIASWISSLEKEYGKNIPYHISRFFPRSSYADRKPTDLETMNLLYETAKKNLKYVYLGNC